MPLVVPRLDNNRVAPAPLQLTRPRATPDGAGFEALGSGLAVAGNVAARLEDERDTRRVMESETALRSDWLAVDRGMRERAGVAAEGATRETEEWLGKKRAELDGALDNDRQRKAFARVYDQVRIGAVDGVSRHEARERRVATDSAIDAAIGSSIDSAAAAAAADADRPGAVDQAVTAIEERIQARAKLRGYSPELVAAERAKHLTKLHRSVLDSMIDRNPGGARAYYAKHREQIAGTDHAEIEKVLQSASRIETAQGFADQVVGKMSESAALAQARKQFSGEDERSAVAEIRQRYGEREQTKNRAERSLADAAWDYESRGQKIPTSVWANVDGRTRLAIEAERREKLSGQRTETDWGRYYELTQEAARDPQGFLSRDLRSEFAALAPGQRSQLSTLQASLRNQDEALSAATLQQQIGASADILKLKDKEDRGRFESAAQTSVQEEQRAKGRKLSQEERRKVLDRLMLEGEVESGSWWRPDANKRYFEVVGTPEAQQFVGAVPDVDRDKIVAAYRKLRKREPTEREISDTYLGAKAAR